MIDSRVEGIREHIEEIMKILEIEKTESNAQTPLRIAKMWVNELFANRNNKNMDELNASMKLFSISDDLTDNIVIMKDIPFNSMCEHHWMPFSGKICIGYVPTTKIVGLSKIPRAVKFFSKKPQLQEKLVEEIADYLFKVIKPKALFVLAEATHTCVVCRGIESRGETDTFTTRGELKEMYMFEFFMRVKGTGI